MKFEVFDSINDSSRWLRFFDNLPTNFKDIYFHPEYVDMHKFIKGSRSLLFIYYDSKDFWAHSFIYQPINLSYANIKDNQWFDIESVYGYGGPISNSKNNKFIKNANDCFTKWAIEKKIIASFIRFNPLISNHEFVDKDTEII